MSTRIKPFLCITVASGALLCMSPMVQAQGLAGMPEPGVGIDRDAAFMPTQITPQDTTPTTAPVAATSAPLTITAPTPITPPTTITVAAPIDTMSTDLPPAGPATPQPIIVPKGAAPLPTTAVTATPVPIVIAPSAPLGVTTPTPVVVTPPTSAVHTPAPVPVPAPYPVAAKPILPDTPVEAAPLNDIDPQSIGLLSGNDGSLGAAMWKGTSRSVMERLLPSLNLPTPSATLNSLAQRFLLTTASVPPSAIQNATQAQQGQQSLVSMRVEKLLALGDVINAWNLAAHAKPNLIDDVTLQQIVETALVTGVGDVCSKLPEMMKTHNGTEWQQILAVCQLHGNDAKAAQLTLDLLHSQDLKDETFFYLTEKNIIGQSKTLPRQLTPLKPLTLALLQMAQKPIPGEVYTHAPAALVPALLQIKGGRDETPRISTAERAAAAGTLGANELAVIYASIPFTPDVLASPTTATNLDAQHMRALIYQVAAQEKQPEKRVGLITAFFRGTPANLMSGNMVQLLAALLQQETASTELLPASATIAHIYLLANQTTNAAEWLKIARTGVGNPDVMAELSTIWPLIALSNLETDTKYASDLAAWVTTTLQVGNPVAARERAASILLLLQASGFAIADENWVRVADAQGFDKRMMPPTILLERLRDAGTDARRGEAVLLSLLINTANDSNNGKDEASPLGVIESVRSLRLVGLTSDAMTLAREAANMILTAPVKP